MLWTKPRLNEFFIVKSSDVILATPPVPASIETVLLRGVLPGVYTDDLACLVPLTYHPAGM